MKKVIILKGLPASGKSTWAKKQIDENPGMYKRVNKDDLRLMLDNSKWSKDNEKFVLKMRDTIILEALEEGKHVIVDDTNLHEKHEVRIRQITKGKASVEVKEFNEDPEVCIKRDLARANSVGQDVIMDMYNNFLKPKETLYTPDTTLPKAVIFDIDGTLAHMNNRSPYDWNRVGEDEVDSEVKEMLDMYRKSGNKIILLTGRDGSCIEQTKKWLHDVSIEYDELFTRQEGDTRKDSVIKREIFENHIAPKYNVKLVVDDRNQVVKMWRSIGIKCFQVADGNF